MRVNITSEEKLRCLDFAKKIILGSNQYNRFKQSLEKQITRTYVGKLAELVFFHYLQSNNIDVEEGDMFEIYEGQNNVDSYDFLLPNGKSIDIKTASLPFHKRIMIPISQFHLRKDYYVGIKLNFETRNNEILPDKIENCDIYGFVTREILEKEPTFNFGEGDCKSFLLSNLSNINGIIKLYK